MEWLGWATRDGQRFTYPSRKAVKAVMGKVRKWCRELDTSQPLDALLQLNRLLRGWCAYFWPGVSHAAFQYLSHYTWARVFGWLRRKHRRTNWKDLRRRYCDGRWWPHGEERELFDPGKVRATRYRYRGTAIPAPWPKAG
ncbi:group II intron maturase-specific domain-containing protein [Streptomyces sp. NPDC002523]